MHFVGTDKVFAYCYGTCVFNLSNKFNKEVINNTQNTDKRHTNTHYWN